VVSIAHDIQELSGLTIAREIKQLRPLPSTSIAINGTTETFCPDPGVPKRNPGQTRHPDVARRLLLSETARSTSAMLKIFRLPDFGDQEDNCARCLNFRVSTVTPSLDG